MRTPLCRLTSFAVASVLTTAVTFSPLAAQILSPTAFAPGMDGRVRSILARSATEIYVGGDFTSAGGVPATGVALWNDSGFVSLGSNIDQVASIANRPSGVAIAGVVFGVGASVQTFDSTTFALTTLPAFALPGIRKLVDMPNGDLVAVGNATAVDGAWRFDGAAWTPIVDSIAGTGVRGFVLDADVFRGSLVVAGLFTAPGVNTSNMATFNGTSWVATDGGAPSNPGGIVEAMHVVGGDIITSVRTTSGTQIYRFDGVTWTSIGKPNAIVRDIENLPNGDLVIAGDFTVVTGVSAISVAKYDGTSWAAVDDTFNAPAYALELAPGGLLAVGGEFSFPTSKWVAGFDPRKVPTVVDFGTGCSAATLQALNLPFIGTTFNSQAQGTLPGVALQIRSVTPLVFPLNLFIAGAPPACLGFISPELVTPISAPGSAVTIPIVIPNDPNLVGIEILQQAVLLGSTISATNAQRITLGNF